MGSTCRSKRQIACQGFEFFSRADSCVDKSESTYFTISNSPIQSTRDPGLYEFGRCGNRTILFRRSSSAFAVRWEGSPAPNSSIKESVARVTRCSRALLARMISAPVPTSFNRRRSSLFSVARTGKCCQQNPSPPSCACRWHLWPFFVVMRHLFSGTCVLRRCCSIQLYRYFECSHSAIQKCCTVPQSFSAGSGTAHPWSSPRASAIALRPSLTIKPVQLIHLQRATKESSGMCRVAQKSRSKLWKFDPTSDKNLGSA